MDNNEPIFIPLRLESIRILHVTFAYTSPPPRLLLDAPRGTFYPPPWPHAEMPRRCRFDGVRRLVVRDANADFVAFLTTTCPRLERVESTAEFCLKDVPQSVSEDVRAKLAFVRLPRTTTLNEACGPTGSSAFWTIPFLRSLCIATDTFHLVLVSMQVMVKCDLTPLVHVQAEAARLGTIKQHP
ncbi:hypothetical protein B0H13DRAFT_2307310 [Mycena leptocephala]|nr:hypothetical protein B0H13DRAFT_2307310 [Mycena leptocephala]